MKIKLLILLIIPSLCFAQIGTIAEPFTSLQQAANVTTQGSYHFNISGNIFNTVVTDEGYVQIAIDFGNGTGNLGQTTSLNSSSRGILNPTILASLTTTTEIKISSSTGNIDVTNTNGTLINRVINNQTLHGGKKDNNVNNDWTGTNATRFTVNATCNSSLGTSLHQNIIHVCGSTQSFNWISKNNYQRERWNLGEVASTVSFSLWVKSSLGTLPIELIEFNSKIVDNSVRLDWKTAIEINNDFFTIEKSTNGEDWRIVTTLSGAGNSNITLQYEVFDRELTNGTSYYRLKQTDYDGQFTYSEIKSVEFDQNENIEFELYPNPTSEFLYIKSNKEDLADMKIFNALGKDLSSLTNKRFEEESKIVLDLSNFNSGIYFIQTNSGIKKVYKK